MLRRRLSGSKPVAKLDDIAIPVLPIVQEGEILGDLVDRSRGGGLLAHEAYMGPCYRLTELNCFAGRIAFHIARDRFAHFDNAGQRVDALIIALPAFIGDPVDLGALCVVPALARRFQRSI